MLVRSSWYAALCLALFAFDAAAQPAKPTPVPAGFLFKGSYLNAKAPNTGGWFLLESSPRGIAFARPGLSKGESLAAQVLMFELKPTQTPDEFVALVNEGIQKSHDPQRFDFIESRTEYTTERQYPCGRNYS